ncbi:NAD(P)/FAD-dependent oxidoreductase [Pseudoduganella sp.]|uniref:NAD(P)/FAD-dependent oxidoreductase n=1 Tax=Pseudoduganella sp. TaxID=1880898 RepID=UPI0035B1FDEC
MKKQEILVLGAGMVGTSIALELSLRGHDVTLVDRRMPGQETSFGNAGVIQREAVEPYPMPRAIGFLCQVLLRREASVNYHLRAMLESSPQLWRYWRASAPARHQRISRHYTALISHATETHARLIEVAQAAALIRKTGIRMLYRSAAVFEAACLDAERIQRTHGIGYLALDSTALERAEPGFRIRLPGALHWPDSWSASDPGALVEHYFQAFQRLGGRFVMGDAHSLRPVSSGWGIESADGPLQAPQVVIALGPWAGQLTTRLGYRLPLFVKRGYHRHYVGGGTVSVPTLDAERGYVMSPQSRGLRITTGAEIARMQDRPTPTQLTHAEQEADKLLGLGAPLEEVPWVGARPCVADMLPVIGPAPRHRGIWFNFGHGHQGFTLGPASARLLADLMESATPFVPPEAYSPARFV